MRGLATGIAVLLCAAPIVEARPERRVAQAPDAQTVRTTQAVVLRKKPQARAPIVAKLPANAVVTIDKPAEKGWVRIRATLPGKRAKEVVGYVLAGSIQVPEPVVAAPPPSPDDTPATDTPITPEQRATIEQVVIHDKPGEKQKELATLPAGTAVTVEAERGRWLRVRTSKVVGYVARTQLAAVAPVADAPVAETVPSRWSATRGDTSELYAEVPASATLRAQPAITSPPVTTFAKGTRLVVVDATTTTGWVRVRNPDGQEGWIAAGELGNGAASSALDAAAPAPQTPTSHTSVQTTVTPVPRTQKAPLVRLDVGLGYRVLGMDFSSNGSSGLANYIVSADASALDVVLDSVPVRVGAISVGIDGRGSTSRSSPGIEYLGPTLPSGKIPFSTYSGDAGVRAGVHLRALYVLALRGGLHYDAFIARDVENAGMLPRERLLGGTLGARADITPPGSRFAATLHADVLIAGSRKQTPGLEDGTASSARALWGGATVHVQLARHISLLSAYDFGRMTTTWSGDSMRMPGVTRARRVDSTQLVQLGLSVEM